jgi:hypothetical protein
MEKDMAGCHVSTKYIVTGGIHVAKAIETGHVVIEDDAEDNISESLLAAQQNNSSEASLATTPEVETEAETEETISPGTDTQQNHSSLTLIKAASFLSNGILFKYGVAQPVDDEAFRKKLIDTGLFRA